VDCPANAILALRDKYNAFARRFRNAIYSGLDCCRIVSLAIRGGAEAAALKVHGVRIIRPHWKHRLGCDRL
jgi:hypothetical protein